MFARFEKKRVLHLAYLKELKANKNVFHLIINDFKSFNL